MEDIQAATVRAWKCKENWITEPYTVSPMSTVCRLTATCDLLTTSPTVNDCSNLSQKSSGRPGKRQHKAGLMCITIVSKRNYGIKYGIGQNCFAYISNLCAQVWLISLASSVFSFKFQNLKKLVGVMTSVREKSNPINLGTFWWEQIFPEGIHI